MARSFASPPSRDPVPAAAAAAQAAAAASFRPGGAGSGGGSGSTSPTAAADAPSGAAHGRGGSAGAPGVVSGGGREAAQLLAVLAAHWQLGLRPPDKLLLAAAPWLAARAAALDAASAGHLLHILRDFEFDPGGWPPQPPCRAIRQVDHHGVDRRLTQFIAQHPQGLPRIASGQGVASVRSDLGCMQLMPAGGRLPPR